MSDTPRIDWYFSASEKVCNACIYTFTLSVLSSESCVWSIALSWYYRFASEGGNQRIEGGTDEGREEHLWSSMLKMPKLTIHSTHCGEKCGNSGWEVRQRKLWYGEQGDLRECRAGREMAVQADGQGSAHKRETVLTAGDPQSVEETKRQDVQ